MEYEGEHVLIAVGGEPTLPEIPGACDTSDNFFEWDSLPQKVVVVGAGYIAVELAGIVTFILLYIIIYIYIWCKYY